MGPIRPFLTEDRDEAMGCASGCFIYVLGVVLAFVIGGLAQTVWQTNWLSLLAGVLALVGGLWVGSRLWPRVER